MHVQTSRFAGSTLLRDNAWKQISYRPTQHKNWGSVKGKQSIFFFNLGFWIGIWVLLYFLNSVIYHNDFKMQLILKHVMSFFT